MLALGDIARGIDATTSTIGKAAGWLNLPILAIILLDVVFRRFLNIGSVGLQELEWHLHALLFLAAAAYTLRVDGHVRIEDGEWRME